MTFWSGEKLRVELPRLISPYDPKYIDCASYQLHLGDQVLVTNDKLLNGDADAPTIQVLNKDAPGHTVCIMTGQFAFLSTEEAVTVPNYGIALINIKTKLKFKGLINVSGFHVDPGFSNKLIFGVYNAGAQAILLERGQPLAMIVYADLDQTSSEIYKGAANERKGIGIELIQDMTGQVFSPMGLQREMKVLANEHQRISTELVKIITRSRLYDGINLALASVLVAVLLAIVTNDTAKVAFGWMAKTSIDLYNEKTTHPLEYSNGNTGATLGDIPPKNPAEKQRPPQPPIASPIKN